MARKKSSGPGELRPPGLADAAGSLATYAAGFLAQPEARSYESSLTLGRVERALLIGLPELDGSLKGRLAVPTNMLWLPCAMLCQPFTLSPPMASPENDRSSDCGWSSGE